MLDRGDEQMSENEREIRTPLQKRSIAKKNAVIATAKEMFLEEGYIAVNTNEIAKKAGVSVGTLYSYFKDKREIFLHIMEECNSEFRELCNENRPRFEITDDPRNVIEHFFDTLMNAMGVYGSLHGEYINHVASTTEEKREFFAEQNKIMFQMVMDMLNIWESKLRISNKEIATLMVLEWGFTVADLISGKRHPVPPELLKHEMLDTICRYLFY